MEKFILKNADYIKKVLNDLLLLMLSFFTSLMLAPLMSVRYKNPYNISNPLNSTGFNPDNNFYSFMFIIIATILLFLAYRCLYGSKYRQILKVITAGLLIVSFFLSSLLINPSYTTAGILDNFHGGEQLSVVNAFLNGSSLYDDLFFLRGSGVDVIVPALGMQLFGETIGGFIMTMDFLQIGALLSFFVLLAFLIKNPLKYTAVAVIFYLSNAVNLVQYRDILTWLVFGLVLLLFKLDLKRRYRNILLFLIGLISTINIYISIDRGMLLLAMAVLLFISLILFSSDKNNSYSFCPKLWRRNLINGPQYLFIGLFIGFLVPAVLLGKESFVSFVKMTFIEIPSFAGLLVSQPIPSLFSDQYLFWAPVFIAIATALLLITLYISDYKNVLIN